MLDIDETCFLGKEYVIDVYYTFKLISNCLPISPDICGTDANGRMVLETGDLLTQLNASVLQSLYFYFASDNCRY